MKKNIRNSVLVILVLILCYTIIWLQSYSRAKEYYIMAMDNYNNGDYMVALKGEKTQKEDGSGYTYIGGFQQALEVFEGDYAYPKPSITHKANEMSIQIIVSMDMEESNRTFKTYFGIDNRFLPEIMLHIGDLHLQGGSEKKAKKAYEMVMEAFERYDGMKDAAVQRINELEQ